MLFICNKGYSNFPMRTYTTVKRGYEGFTKKIMGTAFSSWRYIHKYFILQRKRIRQICRPINHFILAAIIVVQQELDCFRTIIQTQTNQTVGPHNETLKLHPAPNCSCIRASNGRCFAGLAWKFTKKKKKKSNSRQSWIKPKACQSSKSLYGRYMTSCPPLFAQSSWWMSISPGCEYEGPLSLKSNNLHTAFLIFCPILSTSSY